MVACSFSGYHAVKRMATSDLRNSDPLEEVVARRYHKDFIDDFCNAARSCGLRTRSVYSVLANL